MVKIFLKEDLLIKTLFPAKIVFIGIIPISSHLNQKCVGYIYIYRDFSLLHVISWCLLHLHVALIIADYFFRYSEAEAFRYMDRLLLKVFLLLQKMCSLPVISSFA